MQKYLACRSTFAYSIIYWLTSTTFGPWLNRDSDRSILGIMSGISPPKAMFLVTRAAYNDVDRFQHNQKVSTERKLAEVLRIERRAFGEASLVSL